MIRQFVSSVVALSLLTVPAIAAEWKIDNVHSSVQFKVRHMVVSRTKGEFRDFEGMIQYDGDLAKGSVTMTIKTASLNTNDEGRDKHVRSEEFLDAVKYPVMTFTSKKIVVGKDGGFRLTGDFTIKDVTKEVTFDCEYFGETIDPWGNARMGFSASTKIDRHEFHISFSSTLDSGGLIVGNEVEILLEIEAIKVKPEKSADIDTLSSPDIISD